MNIVLIYERNSINECKKLKALNPLGLQYAHQAKELQKQELP